MRKIYALCPYCGKFGEVRIIGHSTEFCHARCINCGRSFKPFK